MIIIVQALWSRAKGWRTTAFGCGVAAVWEYLVAKYLSAACQAEIGQLWLHIPAAVIAVIGTFVLKDPRKIDAILDAIRPPLEKVKTVFPIVLLLGLAACAARSAPTGELPTYVPPTRAELQQEFEKTFRWLDEHPQAKEQFYRSGEWARRCEEIRKSGDPNRWLCGETPE